MLSLLIQPRTQIWGMVAHSFRVEFPKSIKSTPILSRWQTQRLNNPSLVWLNICILGDSGSYQADNLTLTIKDTYCSFHNSSFPLFCIAVFDDDDEQQCYCTWCVHKTYFWSVQKSAHVIQKKQTIRESIGQDMRPRKTTSYSWHFLFRALCYPLETY